MKRTYPFLAVLVFLIAFSSSARGTDRLDALAAKFGQRMADEPSKVIGFFDIQSPTDKLEVAESALLGIKSLVSARILGVASKLKKARNEKSDSFIQYAQKSEAEIKAANDVYRYIRAYLAGDCELKNQKACELAQVYAAYPAELLKKRDEAVAQLSKVNPQYGEMTATLIDLLSKPLHQ